MTTAVSNYKITDYRFLATDLAIMHGRLSGNNEKKALDMRKEMAGTIMQMYKDNGSSISQEEALAIVDQEYRYMSGGATVVDTIQQTTQSANSFWNYVPIVNLFIDDTTAEDLYAYMDGDKDVDTTFAEGKLGKTVSTTAQGAAIGAGLGLCGGPFAPLTCTAGAIIGGIIGLVSGLID